MASSKTHSEPSTTPARQGTYGVVANAAERAAKPRAGIDTYELRINYVHPLVGQLQNVMHFEPDVEPTEWVFETLQYLAGAFQDHVQDLLLPMLGNDVQIASYATRRVTGGSPTATLDVLLHGTASGPVDNTCIAQNIDFIPFSEPWNYGHFYVPGVPDTAFTGNLFSSGYSTQADQLAAALTADIPNTGGSVGNWTAVIYSRGTPTVPGSSRSIGGWFRSARAAALGKRLRPLITNG